VEGPAQSSPIFLGVLSTAIADTVGRQFAQLRPLQPLALSRLEVCLAARCRPLDPRPGPLRRIGHALAAEAVAESVRGHGIGEAEPHVELLRLVAASLARSLQASLALKCVELSELTAKAAGR
jgi:hypothetical protein